MHSSKTQYRSEIDGLRAISVLAVILYHAKFSFISGGFGGVDVFFVISGYLIGGQILADLEAGQFSYRSFYGRRARRILPALFAVILCTAAVGYFVLLPNDYRYFFGAALSSLLSISNFWFMDQIDYFNPQAALDPLVHTWSLGVEEQFYFFAPLLLGAAWLWSRRFLTSVVIVLAIASFGLMLALSESAPMFTFYMLPTRAWELLAGIIVAIAIGKPWWVACQNKHAQFAFLGLAMLLGGLIFIPSGAAWPGLWTVVPVTGTVLVLLFGGARSGTKVFLSAAPIRFIGLVSYSAYLWHQPILSFLGYTQNMPDSIVGRLLVVGLVFVFAVVSWRVIELPFRSKFGMGWKGKTLLIGSAVAIVVMSFGGHFTKGFTSRMPQETANFLDNAQRTGQFNKPCLLSRADVETSDLSKTCIVGQASEPTVALWGDSHAATIADGLGEVVAASGRSLQTFMLSSCLPVPHLLNHSQTRQAQCPAFNASVEDYILASDSIEYVVLFATWDNYIMRDGYPNMFGYVEADSFFAYPEKADPNMPERDRLDGFQTELDRLIKTLTASGKTVILVQSVPRPDVDVPRHFARLAWAGSDVPANSGYDIAYFQEQSEQSRRMFENFAPADEPTAGHLFIVDPAQSMCDEVQCFVIKDGAVLFSDGNHLSMDGALLFLPLIAASIQPL